LDDCSRTNVGRRISVCLRLTSEPSLPWCVSHPITDSPPRRRQLARDLHASVAPGGRPRAPVGAQVDRRRRSTWAPRGAGVRARRQIVVAHRLVGPAPSHLVDRAGHHRAPAADHGVRGVQAHLLGVAHRPVPLGRSPTPPTGLLVKTSWIASGRTGPSSMSSTDSRVAPMPAWPSIVTWLSAAPRFSPEARAPSTCVAGRRPAWAVSSTSAGPCLPHGTMCASGGLSRLRKCHWVTLALPPALGATTWARIATAGGGLSVIQPSTPGMSWVHRAAPTCLRVALLMLASTPIGMCLTRWRASCQVARVSGATRG